MLTYHTALRAFLVVATHYKRTVTEKILISGDEGDPEGSILRMLHQVDLEGRVLRGCDVENLPKLGSVFPVLAKRETGHWMILVDVAGNGELGYEAFVLDIENEGAGVQRMPLGELAHGWGGLVILCAPRKEDGKGERTFGFGWFLAEIVKYKRFFADVALASVVTSLLSFVSPLLYNVIIDKIIPHRSFQTLYVVGVVFVLTAVFEALFGYLRQNLILLTTNKIDATLASKMFQRMLGLPMGFFERMPAGVIFRHLQQTERIRNFLTGRLFQTALDTVSLPFLICLLVGYSWKLTAIVFVFSLLIAAVIGVMVPMFRSRLDELFSSDGARQAHSIETIHGIRTVKSLCLEAARMKVWDSRVVSTVRKAAEVAHFGMVGQIFTGILDKAMQLSVLCLGAVEVFNDRLSIGALVAFSMLSNRVSGPLLQIVGLINEYQETAMSVRMLGSVMNHPPEREATFRGSKPPIVGRLDFENLSFSYAGASQRALDGLNFTVMPGQVIGVVGRSGSGKTTVTRLMQGIHVPSEGIIKLDGVDLRQIDLQHLRRNVGVVLQESFLFRGTIRENIAASNPDATTSEVIEAARLAGAEEFIDQLPAGYDSVLEEGATNLSGGQRQRIAIARALLPQPKLLIFDEATSALDPESEAIIQGNLAQIAKGRSMIIVSHRLSSLVKSDLILVLNRGRVVDFAPHTTLLSRCEIYAHLWHQQTRDITS